MKIKLECCHAGTCLPDYWSGHHLPHVSIPVYNGMTMREIKRAIASELADGAVMGSEDDARLLSADWVLPGEEKRAEALTKAAYAAVNRIKPGKKYKRKFFTDIPEQTDDCETVYAFFVFMEL